MYFLIVIIIYYIFHIFRFKHLFITVYLQGICETLKNAVDFSNILRFQIKDTIDLELPDLQISYIVLTLN